MFSIGALGWLSHSSIQLLILTGYNLSSVLIDSMEPASDFLPPLLSTCNKIFSAKPGT